MASSGNSDTRDGFARAFGRALRDFINETGMTQVQVAERLGLKDKKSGEPSKSRVNTYLEDSPPMPEAQVLYRACTRLSGFRFEYEGYRLNVVKVRTNGAMPLEKTPEEMIFRFNRQFNLTDKKGAITERGAFGVKVKRPPGRIEFSVSLKAKKSS